MKTQTSDREALHSTHNQELAYQQRMVTEPWRAEGLDITQVCRCEKATPCFEHIIFLADTRTMAQDLLDQGQGDKGDKVSNEKAKELFLYATNLYLKLTDI